MVKYELIAADIREKINNGTYLPESILPDQVSLCKTYDCSRMTIKKAFDVLALEGLVYRQRGAGTFVMKNALANKQDASLRDYDGLTKMMGGNRISSKIIAFDIAFPDEKTQEQLLIKADQPVYKLIRLRLLDGEPYVLEHTTMPADLVPGLTKEILHHSIYAYLQDSLGLVLSGAFRKINADKPSEYDQEYLACGEHDPVLEVEQVVYLKDGRPVEYSRSRHRYDTRSFIMVDHREK
ncbi:GntR family transcriptional regulator [Listeria swaminathanii]|uniref:GntR family transcriptional regulator n=1 Tax=Listeria swaminathanii TaxID=2713501 RepID=A0ABU2IDU5_9LIST|nr:GntR family transcriptional regulator [Listeria swaminathanii]MDT0016191.1 GntR family transcriptional regulator [Listeria swaminathanii]MDT0021627.1 GntR family transcriptional regulator [Listeria swaminathanii]MDT0032591.1 GntR family transcriptional regulator [Listeria swaminathanii]MDT0051559.1 GntR family transcriptional regulator [Listeria swaminathanii]MDT0054324.1 GntR family transcriptional regulator [Listeria swaminathanii]